MQRSAFLHRQCLSRLFSFSLASIIKMKKGADEFNSIITINQYTQRYSRRSSHSFALSLSRARAHKRSDHRFREDFILSISICIRKAMNEGVLNVKKNNLE